MPGRSGRCSWRCGARKRGRAQREGAAGRHDRHCPSKVSHGGLQVLLPGLSSMSDTNRSGASMRAVPSQAAPVGVTACSYCDSKAPAWSFMHAVIKAITGLNNVNPSQRRPGPCAGRVGGGDQRTPGQAGGERRAAGARGLPAARAVLRRRAGRAEGAWQLPAPSLIPWLA